MESESWEKYDKRWNGFRSWAGMYSENTIQNVCNGKVEIIWFEKIKKSIGDLTENLG